MRSSALLSACADTPQGQTDEMKGKCVPLMGRLVVKTNY